MTGRSWSVLVVEDEPAHAAAIRRRLESPESGWQVRCCGSLREYRQKVAERVPDIALIDQLLPDGRAVEGLAEELGRTPFPVVIMTSHGDEQGAVAAIKAGSLDYLVKSPEAFAELPHTLDRAMREWGQRAQQERTEAALRESEARYRSLFDHSGDYVLVIEQGQQGELVIVDANEMALRSHGYSRQELLGQPVSLLDPEVTPEIVSQRLGALQRSGPQRFTVRHRRKDGTTFQAEASVAAVQLGTRTLLVSVERDITERIQAESAVRLERDRAQQYFDTAAVIMVVLDSDGRVVRVNRKGNQALQYAEGELVGRDWFETCLPPTARAEVGAVLSRLRAGEAEAVEVFENTVLTKSGSERLVRWHNSLLSDAAGDIMGTLGSGEDITEQRRAEDALRQSEERFRLLFEGARDAIFWADADTGIITHCNLAAEALLDRSRDEIIGQHQTFIHPPEQADHYRELFRLGGTEWPSRAHEAEVVRRDGSRTPVDISPSVTAFGGGRITQGSFRDITERKRAEAERLELERRVLHAQKLESLGVLAGGIAHDFNNLLLAVLGNLDLVASDVPPASLARTRIEQAIQAARRAADLTRQMLAYSGRGRFVTIRIDLGRLARENSDLLRASMAHTVRFDTPEPKGPAIMEGDPGQLQQVTMNLITNASEAIGSNPGVVTLTTGTMECDEGTLNQSRLDVKPAPGRFAFVEVKDTGCGMSEEVQERLFDPFFTTKFTGRGLGMSAVLGIVRGHGGAIIVDSAAGHGTSIRVLFPACQGTVSLPSPRHPETPIERPPATSRSGKILVVDDDEAVRGTCERLVWRLGFETLAAGTGRAALALHRERGDEIALTLLDLTMPGMDGAATFRELIHLRPDARVVLVSGFSEEEAMDLFTDPSPAGFLQKPFRLDDLGRKLKEILPPTE